MAFLIAGIGSRELKHQNCKFSGNDVNSNPSQTTIAGLLSEVFNTHLLSGASHACLQLHFKLVGKKNPPWAYAAEATQYWHHALMPSFKQQTVCIYNVLSQSHNLYSLYFYSYINRFGVNIFKYVEIHIKSKSLNWSSVASKKLITVWSQSMKPKDPWTLHEFSLRKSAAKIFYRLVHKPRHLTLSERWKVCSF